MVVVGVEVGLGELVRVAVAVEVAVPDGDAVLVDVGVEVDVEVPVDVPVDVAVAVDVEVVVDVPVAVDVPVEVDVPVAVPVDVPVEVPVAVVVVGHVVRGETQGVCCARGFSFAPAWKICTPPKTHITTTRNSATRDSFLDCMSLPSTRAEHATYPLKETNLLADRCIN